MRQRLADGLIPGAPDLALLGSLGLVGWLRVLGILMVAMALSVRLCNDIVSVTVVVIGKLSQGLLTLRAYAAGDGCGVGALSSVVHARTIIRVHHGGVLTGLEERRGLNIEALYVSVVVGD